MAAIVRTYNCAYCLNLSVTNESKFSGFMKNFVQRQNTLNMLFPFSQNTRKLSFFSAHHIILSYTK